MINDTKLQEIDITSKEGKLLMSALAILTTKNYTDKTPDDVISILVDLSNRLYHEEEYKSYLKDLNRQEKIDSILINDKTG